MGDAVRSHIELSRHDLAAGEHALLPSDDDVAKYRAHGWYLSQRLLDEDELDELVAESVRYYSGARDRVLPARPPRLADWTPEHGDVQRNNDYIQYTSDTFRRILCKPIIGAVAAKLAGTQAIRILQATLLYKPPIDDEPTNIVSWHYDQYYWSTCSSVDMLTAFIPFHDCDERHGTLHVIEGSHRWRSRHGTNRPASPEDDLARDSLLQRDAEANGAQIHKTPVRIPRGHMSFHHCLLYHGSGPNVAGVPRQSISLHLQDDANRYRPYADSDGRLEPYKHDSLVRRDAAGRPDYGDPRFCPQVWPDIGHSATAAWEQ
jgi:hypothetical protein